MVHGCHFAVGILSEGVAVARQVHEPERMFDRHVLPRPPQRLLRLIEHAAIDRLARKLAARLAEASSSVVASSPGLPARPGHPPGFVRPRDCVRPDEKGRRSERTVTTVRSTLVGCVHSWREGRPRGRPPAAGRSGSIWRERSRDKLAPGSGRIARTAPLKASSRLPTAPSTCKRRILGRALGEIRNRQRTPHRVRQRGKPGGRGQRLPGTRRIIRVLR